MERKALDRLYNSDLLKGERIANWDLEEQSLFLEMLDIADFETLLDYAIENEPEDTPGQWSDNDLWAYAAGTIYGEMMHGYLPEQIASWIANNIGYNGLVAGSKIADYIRIILRLEAE